MKAKIDQGLLEPGWAGELAPDELDFLQIELAKDKRLAYRWGFRPALKRRPVWAIIQVATLGDPQNRAANVRLARRQIPANSEGKCSSQAQTFMNKASGHIGTRGGEAGYGSHA